MSDVPEFRVLLRGSDRTPDENRITLARRPSADDRAQRRTLLRLERRMIVILMFLAMLVLLTAGAVLLVPSLADASPVPRKVLGTLVALSVAALGATALAASAVSESLCEVDLWERIPDAPLDAAAEAVLDVDPLEEDWQVRVVPADRCAALQRACEREAARRQQSEVDERIRQQQVLLSRLARPQQT